MRLLICYDVNTETLEGRRRLRHVAKICLRFGQRVQKSVFECQVNPLQRAELERLLTGTIDHHLDCLRIYRLGEGRGSDVQEYGQFRAIDFEAPLVV